MFADHECLFFLVCLHIRCSWRHLEKMFIVMLAENFAALILNVLNSCTVSMPLLASLPVHCCVLLSYVAVKAIKKQHLVEVRSMANPPSAVKTALESICLLLGENASDWKAIRSVIVKESFIPTIVNFNTDDIS